MPGTMTASVVLPTSLHSHHLATLHVPWQVLVLDKGQVRGTHMRAAPLPVCSSVQAVHTGSVCWGSNSLLWPVQQSELLLPADVLQCCVLVYPLFPLLFAMLQVAEYGTPAALLSVPPADPGAKPGPGGQLPGLFASMVDDTGGWVGTLLQRQ
jgi:hypothetical protein